VCLGGAEPGEHTWGVQGDTGVCPAPPGTATKGAVGRARPGGCGGQAVAGAHVLACGGGQPTGPRLFLGNFAAFISVQIKAVIAGEMILIGV